MTVTTYRYSLPNVQGQGWAIAFLDSIGCFSVLSDYGNYGHRWPQEPGDFRAFILGCDDSYLIRKLASRDVYDGEKTLANVKRRICELRRAGGRTWTRARAREEWDRLEDHNDLDRREDFAVWYENTGIDEAYELPVYDFDPQAVAFVKKVMPRLRAAIREQLAQEAESEVSS